MEFDLLIKGGFVVDGTGNPWFYADIGILDGRIVEISREIDADAKRIINAKGLIVSPGFIDIHSHSDLTLLINPSADSKVRQGITTEVIGNCGLSAAPIGRGNLDLLKSLWGSEAELVSWNWNTFDEYLKRLEERGVAVNVAPLVGHGTIRVAVMGVDNRDPTRNELEEMKNLVAEAMEAGAFGLSSGLVYLPGCYAKTQELIELCKVVAEYGGIYATHIRGERETILEALREAIEIGEKANIPVQVSHNCPKYGAHGKLPEMFKIYEEARLKGIEVTLDNDTHTDFNAHLHQVLPQWAQAGGKGRIVERLKDPEIREKIKREIIEDKHPGPGYVGLVKYGRWDRIYIFQCKKNKNLIGKTIEEIAKIRGKEPFEVFLDLIIEEEGNISALFNYIKEDDIRTLMKHPLMMFCTDGIASSNRGILKKITGYSPCSFGEYPYILERFVKEERVLTLEEAIRKMTSFPAQKLGLRDRGLIREGMWADIVIFNQNTIKDKATNKYPYKFPLENYPHKYPEGISYVIINGEIVIEKGRQKKCLPGKILHHKPKKPTQHKTP